MAGHADVVVVGAGVVGTACALELSRRGASVLTVDRAEIGCGCSYGNAGWLTPCLASPLPAPGVLQQAVRWMLDPDSPFYVRPTPRWETVRWLVGFARASGRSSFERGTRALVELSAWSLEAFEALHRVVPEPFGFERRGLLLVALTRDGLEASRRDAGFMQQLGIEARVLEDGASVRTVEPAVTGEVQGGVYFPHAAHVEPLDVVQAMAAEARRRGAMFLTATEVYGFETAGTRITSLRTTRGPVRGERYVLAAGWWSKGLARQLGVRVPLLGGKGYAVAVRPFDPAPRVPVKILERRVAVTPRADGVRLAGTLELVDGDDRISARRVEAIVRGAREVLSVPDPPEVVEVWRGLRPCTPDGMPAIGPAPRWSNLFVATGHQMLGLHCAPGTARLTADLLLGTSPIVDPAPFHPGRF